MGILPAAVGVPLRRQQKLEPFASSLAGADKATVEDKRSTVEALGDLDKIKPVPPDPEGKEETPVAVAAQPEAQTEQLGGREGELPADDTPNPAVTPPQHTPNVSSSVPETLCCL